MDLNFLKADLISTKVPRPLSGTLSGHAAGEPFARHVYDHIKAKYPKQTFSQFEYLNHLYSSHPDAKTYEERYKIIQSPAIAFLLLRGKEATTSWSLEKLFEEKQNDTADILVIEDSINIVDVKTKNLAKDGQPPNIISALKLAKMCDLMLNSKQYDTHSITYVGIDWALEDTFLVCKDVFIRSLFKADPKKLYINWAAALQIQFHVNNLDQSFSGTAEEWCREYLKNFVGQAKNRSNYMNEKYVKPFTELEEGSDPIVKG